jgi:hypothetical protein
MVLENRAVTVRKRFMHRNRSLALAALPWRVL